MQIHCHYSCAPAASNKLATSFAPIGTLACLFYLVLPNQSKELVICLAEARLQHQSSVTIPSDYLPLEKWNKQ
jgi:hypothetical protein